MLAGLFLRPDPAAGITDSGQQLDLCNPWLDEGLTTPFPPPRALHARLAGS